MNESVLISDALLSLFQSFPLPLKPLTSCFFSLHSRMLRFLGSSIAKMGWGGETKQNKSQQKWSHFTHPEGSPNRRRETFVQLGGGAQGAELKARDTPP